MSPDALTPLAATIRSATPQTFWLGVGLSALAGVALLALGLWRLHRSRLLADLPTSKIRSAAQGYVELEGWARMMPGEPVHAPLSGQPCAWYSYRIEHLERDGEDRDRGWRTLESGCSEAIFHLEDGTGSCIVDPEGAEITPSIRLCWRGHTDRPGCAPRETGFWARLLATGPYRYTECRIRDNDPLYAVGQFIGLGGHEAVSLNDEIRDVLATWKRDRPGLLRRFDANGDGEIDLREWETARRSAEDEVLRRHAERDPQPETSLMKKPRDGRPFLLSCTPQHTLIGRYRLRAIVALCGFLTVGSGLMWALRLRLA
jgi:hypothetical protein